VRSVQVRLRERTVELLPTLAPRQRTRLTLERRAVEEKGALFGQLFGRSVELLPP
jgi:hypothetical protein